MRCVVVRMALTAVLVCVAALAAQAQAVKLSGDEIRALLTGNTAIGRWQGAKYRQYFGNDGITIYAQEGARSTRGEWRIDNDLQEYQSIWPRDEAWEGWFVMSLGDTLYWVSRSTPPTPFQILDGQQLVPE